MKMHFGPATISSEFPLPSWRLDFDNATPKLGCKRPSRNIIQSIVDVLELGKLPFADSVVDHLVALDQLARRIDNMLDEKGVRPEAINFQRVVELCLETVPSTQLIGDFSKTISNALPNALELSVYQNTLNRSNTYDVTNSMPWKYGTLEYLRPGIGVLLRNKMAPDHVDELFSRFTNIVQLFDDLADFERDRSFGILTPLTVKANQLRLSNSLIEGETTDRSVLMMGLRKCCVLSNELRKLGPLHTKLLSDMETIEALPERYSSLTRDEIIERLQKDVPGIFCYG